MKTDPLLNLASLHIFCTVVQEKLIRNAAKKLGVTPSAISQALAKLEQDLGTELFVRKARPLRLTAAGQVLYKGVPALIEASNTLKNRVMDHSLSDVSLRLGISESVTSTISPWLISELKERVRELECTSLLTRPLIERLRNDRINICVMPDGLLDEDRWERKPLYKEDFLLIRSKKLAANPDDPLQMLSTAPFIGYNREGSSDQIDVERVLRSLNLFPNRVITVSSSYSLVGLVASLGGWAMIPPTNIWCGRQFNSDIVISPLPENRRAVRTMWVLCDRHLYAGYTDHVSQLVKDVFAKKMMAELERFEPGLSRHVQIL